MEGSAAAVPAARPMIPQRVSYQSAFRGQRAPVRIVQPPPPPQVSAPQGAGTNMTAGDQQAAALRNPPKEQEQDAFSVLPAAAQQQLREGYGRGGFEGVANAVGSDWYDLPEWQRTKILDRVRR